MGSKECTTQVSGQTFQTNPRSFSYLSLRSSSCNGGSPSKLSLVCCFRVKITQKDIFTSGVIQARRASPRTNVLDATLSRKDPFNQSLDTLIRDWSLSCLSPATCSSGLGFTLHRVNKVQEPRELVCCCHDVSPVKLIIINRWDSFHPVSFKLELEFTYNWILYPSEDPVKRHGRRDSYSLEPRYL
ncbi:hypothetical protein D3C80_235010 [compost metagenome]